MASLRDATAVSLNVPALKSARSGFFWASRSTRARQVHVGRSAEDDVSEPRSRGWWLPLKILERRHDSPLSRDCETGGTRSDSGE
jgi:hypothetical protein